LKQTKQQWNLSLSTKELSHRIPAGEIPVDSSLCHIGRSRYFGYTADGEATKRKILQRLKKHQPDTKKPYQIGKCYFTAVVTMPRQATRPRHGKLHKKSR
jgi:hypothetical protein